MPIQSVDDLGDDEEECEKVNIFLMTDIKNLHKNEILVAEASKLKVIDTVFTKTVAREKWYQNNRANLSRYCTNRTISFRW